MNDRSAGGAGKSLLEKRQALARALMGNGRRTDAPAGIAPRPDRGPAPLSFAQERLWFLDRWNPGSAVYNSPLFLRLTGPLDLSALERSLTAIVARHEVLRTSFPLLEGRPSQVVRAELNVSLPCVDLSALPDAEREREADRLIREEAVRPFDLAEGPLLRASVVKLGPEEQLLLLTLHHIVTDAWSRRVLTRELAELYGAFSRGNPDPLPALAIQYADYAAWQRDRLQGAALESELAYWRAQLAGAPSLLELPTDRPRPAIQVHHGGRRRIDLPAELADALNALGRSCKATLFMTTLAAFQTLLFRYSGQEDIVVGTPIANRTQADTESLIGFFVNTLALRTDVSGDPTFRELLTRVRETALGAYAHQDLPFEKLVEEIQPERSMSHSPIFQVMFSAQKREGGRLELPGLKVEPISVDRSDAKMDLLLMVDESPDAFSAVVEYDADLFDGETIERLLGHYRRLLEAAAADPDQSISTLPLLTEPERAQLLVEWNDTAADYPRDRCIHDWFEEQAARTPDAIAVVCGAQQVSYRQLNERSNQVAHHLIDLGVRADRLVAVCMERSIEMVAALMGVMKAGGAYVAIDPAYPSARVQYTLEDSDAAVLLTQTSLVDLLPTTAAHTVCLDRDLAVMDRGTDNPGAPVGPRDLAYVLYTSGSTGLPKGVAIEHRSPVALISWALGSLSVEELSGVVCATSICFDLSIYELFVTLCGGGRVILVRDALEIGRLPRGAAPTLINTVPSAIAELLREDGIPETVTRINLAGEPLMPELVDQLYEGTHAERVYDLYGPSEDTTYTTWALRERGGRATIGRPIANTRLYLLDARRQPVPIGVPGELYIAGAGLARGYLHRPDLTAERFLIDPFGPGSEERVYRTGDLCRYLPDGSVEYLGRADHQVKIRGYRIELGEIESVLAKHPAIREAVVLAREDAPGDKRLTAYLVTASDASLGAPEIREHLRASLPEYMVPTAFVTLDRLPRTPSGKVDRKALPRPDEMRGGAEAEYLAPRGPIEEGLAEIWTELLGVERVGIRDGFFELGGHSLMAAQVTSRIRSTFGVDLPLRALFEAPTVEQLAARIDRAGDAGATVAPPLTRAPRDRSLPLSFAQQRLWFIHQLDPQSPAYNMPIALRLVGPLDQGALESSVSEIVRRHEALRTTFAVADGVATQVIREPHPIRLHVVDLGALPEEQREAELLLRIAEEDRRPFDLERGPLLRAGLLRLADEEHVFLLTLHHIVSDGWSNGVLKRELAVLYNEFLEGRPSPLPPLPIQYADYAVWQREWLRGEALERQLGYWKERLSGVPPLLELPADRPRPAVQSSSCARCRIDLPREVVRGLKALGRREGATLFMTLLAAFDALLCRYTGQDDLVVGAPIANRTRSELEGMIGFFVNTLALRADLSGDPTFRELLGRVRESALGAYAHQDLPFDKLVEELMPERTLSSYQSPLFQTAFVLQNAPRADQSLDGLLIEPIEVAGMRGKIDLQLAAMESQDAIQLSLLYSTDLFDPDRMERLLGHYLALLDGALADPEQRVSRLPLLTPGEREQLLVDWNATAAEYPRQRCVHELFEAQVERTPDAVALKFGDERLTFAELNERANQLAHGLRKLDVGPEVLVGLCIDRSIEMVVGMLGILKAGGAYVPLDPSYPLERLSFMIDDATAHVLLTRARLAERCEGRTAKVICLDTEWDRLAGEPTGNPAPVANPDNLAYVIYTSGTTGRPKGAMIRHQGLTNYLVWAASAYDAAAGTGSPVHSSLSFDLTVTSLFPALLAGTSAQLLPEAEGVEALSNALRQGHDLSLVKITPAHLELLAQDLSAEEAGGRTRAFIIGGEALFAEQIASWRRNAPRTRLINEYGPTETVVGCCVYECGSELLSGGIPIGRPIANTRLYLLDDRMEPVAVGIAGELYIGGDGVGRGYLNRPELTAERFVPDPFGGVPGSRLYRTGDLARHQPNGNVEYLGRLDHQVKIRGYRIELGEIESALVSHPDVREAVVLAREDVPGDRRLAAYLVAERSNADASDEGNGAEADQVADWQVVFDGNYAESCPEDDPQFNVSGWTSSYTGQAIPIEEMREWVDNTVSRILDLRPRRVVEVGCGMGLLLFRIAPRCDHYVASDFSREALGYVRRVLSECELPADRVELQHGPADAFADSGAEAPDTVILNSVIQYFPSLDYLTGVLERAVTAVAPGGRIFIGDVRHLLFLDEFQSDVHLAHAAPGMETSRLRQRVRQAVTEEGELLVDPAYFFALRDRLPDLTRVEVQLKRGRHRNEMTCFRYDVVLHAGPERAQRLDVSWRDWTREVGSLDALRDLLDRAPAVVGLTGVSDARVADAIRARALIADLDGPETAAEIRAALDSQASIGLDPEEIWALESEYPYSIRISPSGLRHRGCFDVLMRRHSSADDLHVEFPGHSTDAWATYANDPVRGKLRTTFVPQLRRYVEERLPEYMVPAAFVLLDAMPLTPNGKVDRKALPAPDGSRPELESAYEPPRTPAEEALARIWAEVLRLDRVGIHDNFFELGGDSILSIQIIARANQAGLHLTPRQVFQHQTVAELAELAGTGPVMSGDQGAVVGPVPLTPIQRWFFERDLPDAHHFNQARVLVLHQPVPPPIVERAVRALLAHHDALRLRFSISGTTWRQENAAVEEDDAFTLLDLSGLSEREQGPAVTAAAARLQASLDLERGPLLRAAYFDLGPERPARLLLAVHHLAVDGVSWRVLLADLERALDRLGRGESPDLPAKTTSFRHWAARLVEYSGSEALRTELDYWLAESRARVRPLPVDDPGGANSAAAERVVLASLDLDETRALLQEVPAAYHTQINDALLCALMETMTQWTGDRAVLVDLEGHGREPIFDDVDLSRTVGWFTTIHPLLLELTGSAGPGEALKSVKEQLRRVPNHGMGYGLLRYLCPDDAVRSRLAEMPRAEVSFNYHGVLDQVVRDSGVIGIAPEAAGAAHGPRGSRSHLLDVNSRITGDRLHVSWVYSEEIHTRATVERLADRYLAALRSLIDHCRSPEAGGHTPSDFPMAKVSQEALDRLLAGVRKR